MRFDKTSDKNYQVFRDTTVCPRNLALKALCIQDPAYKSQATLLLARQSLRNTAWNLAAVYKPNEPLPGLPARLQLVHAKQIHIKPLHTPQGRGAMLHALAHIEFNAINLALDAVWRFPNMPMAYYHQWMNVAREEAYHFRMLVKRMASVGTCYGDNPAHNTLWMMAQKTQDSVLARMALVPRLYEARGLDAAPAVRSKLIGAGDNVSAAVIDVIMRDEVGHVAVGNHWYHTLCKQAGLDSLNHYSRLCQQYEAPALKPPFNLEARRAAGFTEAELLALMNLDAL